MVSQILTEYRPASVTPPGATLTDLLEEWGMSQVQLAERMGRPAKTINEIIKGKNAITIETALQLERVFNTPAHFWMEREQKYRAFLAEKEEAKQLKCEQSWLKKVPLKELIQQGFIPGFLGELDSLKAVWTFFGVAGPEPWQAVYEGAAYRKSASAKPVLVATWLRMGELKAHQVRCQPYNAKMFRQVLQDIRMLTVTTPDVFQHQVVEKCAACGVAVVFVKELPGLGVSGVTKWLNPTKALIQLSLRYKTADQLWFTFFHEAAHILKHGKKLVFLEEDGLRDAKEDEANAFAGELLFPGESYSAFTSSHRASSRQSILDFAEQIGVHPGIVVGRLQHDHMLDFAHCNDLKMKLVWAE